MDVVLVLDGSGSIGKENWRDNVVPFAVGIANKLPIDPEYTRLGCVLYHTEAEVYFQMNQAGLQNNAAVGSLRSILYLYVKLSTDQLLPNF